MEWDNSLTAQVVVFDIKCKMGENPFCRKGKGSERQKSLCQKSKKNIESLKVDQKFEKDQNVKSQIRLSMF